MINIKKVHTKFKFDYNKLDSNHKQDFVPAYIDLIINSAVLEFVQVIYSGNSGKMNKYGFEVTQNRIDMLSELVINDEPKRTPSELRTGVFEYPLRWLNEDYLHHIRSYIDTDCGPINLKIVQHDDMNRILNDEFQRPNRGWKRIPANFARSSSGEGRSLYIYTNDLFDVSDVQFEYIKKPNKVFFGNYDTIEYCSGDLNFPNKETDPINLDLPEEYLDYIVDIAVKNVSLNLDDYNQFMKRYETFLTKI